MRVFHSIVFALVLTACSAACTRDKAPPSTTPVSLVTEGCRAVQAADPTTLFAPGSITVFGELHGTVQAPGFLGDLVCHLHKQRSVLVGLELPSRHQGLVDRFLRSAGSEADRQRLRAMDFWDREFQDGRSSEAMFELLLRLRELNAESGRLRVLFFDAPAMNPMERDVGFADQVSKAIRKNSDAVVLLLMGNYHARFAPPDGGESEFTSAAQHLKGRHPQTVSLDMRYGPGSFWACVNEGCGVQTTNGRNGGPAWSIELLPAGKAGSYSGYFHVGELTASGPLSSAAGE